MFYCVDTVARKRSSLHTVDEDKARQIVEAKNLAERQPEINLQIAKAYLAATDSGFVKRPQLKTSWLIRRKISPTNPSSRGTPSRCPAASLTR